MIPLASYFCRFQLFQGKELSAFKYRFRHWVGMLFFLLDPLINGADGFLGAVFTFIVQLISFAGIFIIAFALVQGFVLEKWHQSEFLVGIVIMVLAGPMPGIEFIMGNFPDFLHA